MFKVPGDVEQKLQKKYPNVDISKIIHEIITELLHKTIEDGACTIREFGKFIAFKTFSSRLGRDVPRFKFKVTNALLKKLKNDQYILDNMLVKACIEFTDEQEEKCADRQIQRAANTQAVLDAQKLGTKRTHEKIARDAILEILENN